MSASHGHSTMGGIDKKEKVSHQRKKLYESSTKETKWVCIQLACSRIPRALEEAHCWNIQAKFYNEKFPLVYESDKTKDSLS